MAISADFVSRSGSADPCVAKRRVGGDRATPRGGIPRDGSVAGQRDCVLAEGRADSAGENPPGGSGWMAVVRQAVAYGGWVQRSEGPPLSSAPLHSLQSQAAAAQPTGNGHCQLQRMKAACLSSVLKSAPDSIGSPHFPKKQHRAVAKFPCRGRSDSRRSRRESFARELTHAWNDRALVPLNGNKRRTHPKNIGWLMGYSRSRLFHCQRENTWRTFEKYLVTPRRINFPALSCDCSIWLLSFKRCTSRYGEQAGIFCGY